MRSSFLTLRRVTAGGITLITGTPVFAGDWNSNVFTKYVAANAAASQANLADFGPLPDLSKLVAAENTTWLNSAPLSAAALRGKVVLIDFWTYSCINSLRNMPYVQGWAEKYKDAGLVVIGVHTPEFGFEKDRANVEIAVRDLKVTYPVAVDSSYQIWQAFNNEYWPGDYFIDGRGRIRYQHFGEGDYGESERVIQQLLKENGATAVAGSTVRVAAGGIEAPPSDDIQTSETYVGYRRAEDFASPERVRPDAPKSYSAPESLSLNQWALGGSWNIGAEAGVLQAAPGKIAFRFHSRDLHVVLGPAKNGTPVRFRVTLDGNPPGNNHGGDSTPDGAGEVRAPRLYQLIRQTGRIEDRTFEIEFLDPGVHVFVFTFG
jgi:thiol-disulfide isomerase/thioredoxin